MAQSAIRFELGEQPVDHPEEQHRQRFDELIGGETRVRGGNGVTVFMLPIPSDRDGHVVLQREAEIDRGCVKTKFRI